MLIQEPVHFAIWHCLNHYAYGDATFLAERLFNEIRSDDSLHLLATCYYRSGKLGQAYDVLQANGSRTPQNKFLLAKCCGELSKFSEAEAILTDSDTVKSCFGESASFALQLLASIYGATERLVKAKEADAQALDLNPFLWKSFETLCSMGEFKNPIKVFNTEHLGGLSDCLGVNPVLAYANSCLGQQQPQHNMKGYSNSATSTPILPSQQNTVSSQAQVAVLSQPTSQQQTAANLVTTPVNQLCLDSSIDGGTSESLISMSLWSENFQMLSGVGTLNFTAESEHSNGVQPHEVTTSGQLPVLSPSDNGAIVTPPQQQKAGTMPPPLLRVSRNAPFGERGAMTNRTPLDPVAKRLVWNSGSSHNVSFGHLPQGSIKWNLSSFEQMPTSSAPGSVFKLEDCPLFVLSPGNSHSSTPMPSENLANSALSNATNNEQKVSKRGLVINNPLKSNSNIFGPTGNSQNITPQQSISGNVSPHSNMQSVRRSSRLFGSAQQSTKSCKENTKAHPSTAMKTRKSKSKFSSKTSQAELAEKNEKNKQEKEKDLELEKLSSPSITVTDTSQSQLKVHYGTSMQAVQYQKVMNEQALIIQKSSIEGLMELLRKLGAAYTELSKFNNRKAIQMLDEVPTHQKNSGWILGLFGKAYFELGEYREATKYFKEMRDRDPNRLEFVAYFSTALWHLQEEVELSSLAQELTRLDKLSPHTWCAAGNCFSHQKDHENAIKFLKRAVQVDPHFPYAYTLLGHEYVMIEELEKALSCFRSAVRVNPRHYNAWYGIGLTYYKQERYALAEIYYRKALGINPQSPVLMCHVAVVQHALLNSEKALETLDYAIAMAPRNPLCKFERASILFASERYQEALRELDQLKELVPKESPVYFLIGKVHNKLGNTHLALMHFSWAMDLDPKGANSQIKDALDPALNRANQEDISTAGDIEVGGVEVINDMEDINSVANAGSGMNVQGNVGLVRPGDSPNALQDSPVRIPSNGSSRTGPSREPAAIPMERSFSPEPTSGGGNDDSL